LLAVQFAVTREEWVQQQGVILSMSSQIVIVLDESCGSDICPNTLISLMDNSTLPNAVVTICTNRLNINKKTRLSSKG
jgi:hypothetical protein